MKRFCLIIQLVLMVQFSNSYGQTVLFSEGFESGEIPLNWKQEFVNGAINWRYTDGGYTTSHVENDNSRQPMHAYEGNFNAMFQYQSPQNEATRLVTKRISALEFAVKPELHFYHAQVAWDHALEEENPELSNDYLRVYYKSSAAGTWKILKTYTLATADWEHRIIVLPENGLSADYYLAFEGETHWGWGTCVDDIQILETGIRQKALSEISVEQTGDVPIGSGTKNNPVLRVNLKVTGNSGAFPLNSITVNSLNTNDQDIEAGGVKLFLTRDAEFNADTPVGNGVSFSSGHASFTNLNYSLPTGYSYLWITYDIKQDAGHRNHVDAKLPVNSININGQTYFTQEKSPAGYRTILRTLESDDFESGLNWTLTGEFEYGSPLGLGGSQGNPDPAQAYGGTAILGTDLTGTGVYPGDYEKNMEKNQDNATSDTFDFTYYNDLSLRYMRFLNIGINDEVSIDVSADGGNTWKQAWANAGMILDDSWKLHELDITALAARKKNVRVRYNIGTTNDYWQLSGWNIDNFSITGNYVTKDVGISRIISPLSGCGHTNNDAVTVMVKNYGAEDSYALIPLQYTLGSITVKDTLKQVIPFGDSIQFTFKKKADLSVANEYNLTVTTKMSGDDDATNNTLLKALYIQPTLTVDHTETFETKGGLWIPLSSAQRNWELGAPGYGITPQSGTHLWMTRLVEFYPDNDSSFLESVCYGNPVHDRKIIELKYWLKSQKYKDGASVNYSTDNGLSWQLLDTLVTGWNWYNGTVESLHSKGWSGFSNGWVTARQVLPRNITNASSMKFRMAFASDADSNDIGFAMDDFSVLTAPTDIGVSVIDSFATRCQYLNPKKLTVTIRNFGLNPLKKENPVIVGYIFNEMHMETDTFTLGNDLLPGQVVKHTFSNFLNTDDPGDYTISAYTLNEDDPYFYGKPNDTLTVNFKVLENPFTLLTDTISTREPDTVFIRPFYKDTYDYLWNDMSTNPDYDVERDGWYHVLVTDAGGNGCTSYDSSYVQLLFNDVGVDSLISPYNDCGLSENESIHMRIRNFGTDSIPAGMKVGLGYILNNNIPVRDTLVLPGALFPNKTIDYIITKSSVDLSGKGIYHFRAFASFTGDTIHHNDTLNKSVEIFGLPVVDIGPDMTVQALSYTLDAGPGFVHYSWDNESEIQTREIDQSGTYWVRVKDGNQCENADTAFIWLKIRDIRPDGLSSPVSDCHFTTGEPVSLRILNSGTDTVPAGQHIDVQYQLNTDSPVNGSFNLSSPLFPGNYVTHTFSGDIDLMDAADYNFTVTAVMATDIRKTNDTSDLIIYRYPRPVVDFRLDDVVTIQDIQLEIEAGYSPFYAYKWQDNFDEHLYTATRSGNYSVKATDMRTTCFDGDTVTVFLIYSDVGVTSASLPGEGCTGNFEHVSVRIRNMGTSNIGKNVPIYVACDVNGERILVDTLVRTSNFVTNSNIDLILTSPVTINETGMCNVSFYTLFAEDMKSWDDTLVSPFNPLPSPVVDFGDVDGILTTDLPHILDAGTGNKSYEWQDGSTDQLYTVTDKGIYTVIVTGQNDCQTEKIVSINLSTGMDKNLANEEDVSVYPNPGNGLFYVKINTGDKEDLVLRLINMQGQTVFIRQFTSTSAVPETFDVQHLSRGMYHIVIQGGDLMYQGKMIIQ
jgi:hypothetical protein